MGRVQSGTGELSCCVFSVSVVITDISRGFSVLEDHSKSRLQFEGYLCDHSANSICSIIETLSLSACLFREWQTTLILTSHWGTKIIMIGLNVRLWKWHSAGLQQLSMCFLALHKYIWAKQDTYNRLINTLFATPTWESAPAMGNQNGLHANRYEDGKKLKRK